MTEIAYIEKCMVCAKETPIEAKPGEGEETPELMDAICAACMQTMPKDWGDVKFTRHAEKKEDPEPQHKEYAREPVPIKDILKKREFKDTEVPSYQIWNRWVRGEIDKKEFDNLLAQENVRFIKEFEAWEYPVITTFVRRWSMSSDEEQEQLKKSATDVQLRELTGYLARFSQVREHNQASFAILCDTQHALTAPEDKEKIADFITESYDPYWKTLHRVAFRDPIQPQEDWRNR